MKFKLIERWIKYNANNSNGNVGDCILRALSLVTGLDYIVIRRICNKVAEVQSVLKGGELKYSQCWKEIVHALDISWIESSSAYKKPEEIELNNYIAELTDGQSFEFNFEYIDEEMTLNQFTIEYSSGRYILIVGSDMHSPSHMVAVINGNYYDSWNSGERIVIQAAKLESVVKYKTNSIIKNSRELGEFDNRVDIRKYKGVVEKEIDEKLSLFVNRHHNQINAFVEAVSVIDNTTIAFRITYKLSNGQEISKKSVIKLDYKTTSDKELRERCISQVDTKLISQFKYINKLLK